MLNHLLSKVFNIGKSQSEAIANSNLSPTITPIEDFFNAELDKSIYIKQESRKQVIEHLLHKRNLLKTDNILNAQQKKDLGLNSRQSFTQEFVEILTPAGLALQYPKVILENVYYKCTFARSRIEEFHKFKKLKLTRFTYNTANCGDDCSWCVANHGKEFGLDYLDQIDQNCTCEPYSKSYISPVIEF